MEPTFSRLSHFPSQSPEAAEVRRPASSHSYSHYLSTLVWPPGWALSDLAPCPEDLRKCKPLTMSFSSFPKPQHLSVLDIPGLPSSIHFPFSHTPTLTMWFRRGVGLKSLQVPRAGPDWLTSPAWLHRLKVTGSGVDT